jgi:hypothetical protein
MSVTEGTGGNEGASVGKAGTETEGIDGRAVAGGAWSWPSLIWEMGWTDSWGSAWAPMAARRARENE